MKRMLLGLSALSLLALTGCYHHNLATNGCQSCGDGAMASAPAGPTHVGHLPQGYLNQMGPAGPPTAAYAYPYYTTRAPRDFLMDNPPTIGR